MRLSLQPGGRRRAIAAALACLAVAAVAASVALPQPRARGYAACPAGTIATDPVAAAREARPGASGLELARIRADFGERVCLPASHPEGLARMDPEHDPLGKARGFVAPGLYRAAVEHKQAMLDAGLQAKVAGAGGTWTSYPVGPLIANDPGFPQTYGFGWSELNGRIDNIDYDPVARRLFAVVGTGGVWASDDLGDSWRSIGDRLPTQTMSAVGWTPAGGGTVIVVTGEHTIGSNAYAGVGAYWSNDLGATWHHATGIPDGALAFAVAVDPAHPERVYAGTGWGLFRSVDAGRTYTNVALPVSAECAGVEGLGPCQYASMVTDVVVKAPGGTTDEAGGQVLAAVGYVFGSTLKFLDGTTVRAPGNGLYRSDTGEPGTFARIDVPAASGADGIGFPPQERIGKISLGAATGPGQDHNFVYALVQDAILINGGTPFIDVPPVREQVGVPGTTLNGIYVSGDFGENWIRMADTYEISAGPTTDSSLTGTQGIYPPGVQAWYNQWIRPDPTQASGGVPTRLAFGLEEVWTNRDMVPLDGTIQLANPADFHVIGKYTLLPTCIIGTSTVNSCPTRDTPVGGTTTHPDQHAGFFVPDDDGGVYLFAGNDGGMYRQHAANGEALAQEKWGDGANRGFNTLLPYGLAVAKDGTVWWGHQDNGSGRIAGDTKRNVMAYGGDGFWAATDPDDSRVGYIELTSASMRVTTDGGVTWNYMAPPIADAQFANPFVMDPTDANHLMAIGSDIAETVDGPATCIWEDPEQNVGNCTWEIVFDLGDAPADGTARIGTWVDLEGDAAYVGFCGRCTPGPLGFDNGIATNVGGDAPPQRMTGDGWHIAAAQGLPKRQITGVEIDPTDTRTVYVTLGSYYDGAQYRGPGTFTDTTPNLGDGHVFKSTDAGEHFTDISGNLPNAHTTYVIKRGGQLIVGTDIGAFISTGANGGEWAPLGTGIPNAPVTQMQLRPGDPDTLFVSTYGRGIWKYEFTGDSGPVVTPPPAGVSTDRGRFGGGGLPLASLLVLLAAGLVRARRR